MKPLIKKSCCLLLILVLLISLMPLQISAGAATPLISTSASNPPDCYYHYDGQIWVYSTSKYKAEIKSAIKKINKKIKIFRWTTVKNKCDLVISDKKSYGVYLGVTYPSYGRIYLFKNQLNKVSRAKKVLAIEHELCHAAGLDHSSSNKSLMYYCIRRNSKGVGITAADLKALKKARKRAQTRNSGQRKKILKAFLTMEKKKGIIRLPAQQGGFLVLSFTGRGTTYSSSDPDILSVNRYGMLTVKQAGFVVLKVKNNGTPHKYYIWVG